MEKNWLDFGIFVCFLVTLGVILISTQVFFENLPVGTDSTSFDFPNLFLASLVYLMEVIVLILAIVVIITTRKGTEKQVPRY